jgi:hypothetical protein
LVAPRSSDYQLDRDADQEGGEEQGDGALGIRCWIAVPMTTPTIAGSESSRPVRTWTLP